MHKIIPIILAFSLFLPNQVSAQQLATKAETVFEKPYNPSENAEERIAELILQAQNENKNILIQAGGNWCVWCLRFDAFWKNDAELSKVIADNYLYYHLNWSPENKNEELFKKFGEPGKKYGYPVFLVLNEKGELIHTQGSEVLELGKSYEREKVLAFFEKWKPSN